MRFPLATIGRSACVVFFTYGVDTGTVGATLPFRKRWISILELFSGRLGLLITFYYGTVIRIEIRVEGCKVGSV